MLACTGQNRFWVLLTLISILSCLLILAPFVSFAATFPVSGDGLKLVSFSLCSHFIVNTFIKLQTLSSLVSAAHALGGSAELARRQGHACVHRSESFWGFAHTYFYSFVSAHTCPFRRIRGTLTLSIFSFLTNKQGRLFGVCHFLVFSFRSYFRYLAPIW